MYQETGRKTKYIFLITSKHSELCEAAIDLGGQPFINDLFWFPDEDFVD